MPELTEGRRDYRSQRAVRAMNNLVAIVNRPGENHQARVEVGQRESTKGESAELEALRA